VAAYENALETQRWENVSPLIHDHCTVTFSEGTHIGKSAVEAAFRKTFELIEDERYSMSDLHWIMRTDAFAVFSFTFAWSGVIRGKPASGGGRGTSVIVNQNGAWQLITEHLGPPAQ